MYTVHHSYSDEEKAVEFQKKLNVCEMVIVHTYLTVVSGFLKRDKELNVLLESLKILHMGKKGFNDDSSRMYGIREGSST